MHVICNTPYRFRKVSRNNYCYNKYIFYLAVYLYLYFLLSNNNNMSATGRPGGYPDVHLFEIEKKRQKKDKHRQKVCSELSTS